MSVVIRDDELELFKQNGVTQDQIANTVSTYRNQGLSDNDIRSKVDVKLNEYRSAVPQQQVQQQPIQSDPIQPITPVNGMISGGVTATRTPNWDSNGNIFYTDENGNRIGIDENELAKRKAQNNIVKRKEWEVKHPYISGMQKMYQPGYSSKLLDWESKAKYGNNIPLKERLDLETEKTKKDAYTNMNLMLDAQLAGLGSKVFKPVIGFGRNQLARLAKNPITEKATKDVLKTTGKFAKSRAGKITKYFSDLGKEGVLYGAAHHGLNNVYGVENENSLLGDMAQDAGAFMLFGGALKGAGATGRFANKQLNKKGGVIRNAKADMLRFKRSHPVATRRVDSAISQVKEAIAPTVKYVGDKYYQGIEKLNKLKEKAFSNAEDMLSNDQIAFAKKAGHIDAGSELANAKEELRRIDALKNKSNINIDFDSIENTSYKRALDDLINQGLNEREARSILLKRGVHDPEVTARLLDDVDKLNQKTLLKSKDNPINEEMLNKVEQAIEEGKPITKESIYGNQEDVLPNGNPVNWRDNVRAWREKQKAKSTEIQPETSEQDLNMGKQELGINAPKEDLTHVNEPSVSSNDIPKQNKPVKSDIYIKDKGLHVNKLEPGEAEGADSLYKQTKGSENIYKDIETGETYNRYEDTGMHEYDAEVLPTNRYVSEEPEFIKFYDNYKSASPEEQVKLLQKEFERLGSDKKAFNKLYQDVIEQTERDSYLGREHKVGDKPYEDNVSENFYKQAEELSKTIEDAPHEITIPEVTKATPKERKIVDNTWRQILKQRTKTKPRYILEGSLNKYRTNVGAVQKEYDKLFDSVRNSNATGRTRELLFDDLEKAADKYTSNHGREIKRHKDIAGEKVQANKLLDEIQNSDTAKAGKLIKDNQWLLKHTNNYKGNDIVSKHYEESNKKVLDTIRDKTDANKVIANEVEKANKYRNPKTRKARLKYIEEHKEEIIEQNRTEAEKLWNKHKDSIKTTYTDFSNNEMYKFEDGKRVATGDTWDRISSDLSARDRQWKQIESEIEGKLYFDKTGLIGKHLESGKGLSKYIGQSTTYKDILSKFPKQFSSKFKKMFEPFLNRKIRIVNKTNFNGKNTAEEILLAEGATFKTLKHELGHDLFTKETKNINFIAEHHKETDEVTKLLHDFEDANEQILGIIKNKIKGFKNIEEAVSSGKLTTDEISILEKFKSHYRLYKTCCEEQFCDMIGLGEYTGTVEKFVKTYNEVFPKWLELVEKGDIEGDANTLRRFIRTRLSRSGRAANKISKHNKTYRELLRKRGQIVETNVKGKTKQKIDSYDIEFNENRKQLSVNRFNKIGKLGSKGLNDRGVIETLSKINDGETAEIVTKALRENTLKRTGLLEAEQAAKAINIQEGNGSVWLQSSVPSKVVNPTDVLGKEAKNQKAGAFGNRKSGEIKYTTREDRIKDDFMTAIRADNADALASHGITYSVPLDKKVQGEWVDVNKKALTFGIYTKNSGEWVQTLLAGDKAIEKVFKKEGEDVANYMKQLSKNIGKPDCKIPKDVFDMLLDGSGENAKQYIDRYWGMSFDHSTNLGNKARGIGKVLGGIADGFNAGWKRNKLATLSFIINNRLGNQMLMMAHGGKDYLTSLIEAARMKDTDIPNEILSANIGEAFTDFIKASPGQKTTYTGYSVDKLFNLISGVKLEQVNTKPLTRLKAKDIPVLKKSEYKITNSDKLEKVTVDNSKHKAGSKIGSIYKNGRGNAFPMYAKKLPKNAKFVRVVKNPNNTTKVKFDNTMSKLYNSAAWVDRQFSRYAKIVNKINDKFERFERKQAYSIAKKQYDRAKIKDFLYKTELYKNMANDINKNPIAKDAILTGIENMLGNYRTFTKFEKNFLKRIRPFYSWDRTITRSTLALAKKNPARAAWILYETKRLQNIQPDRKDYQQGSIDLPIKDSRNNKQLLINKREYGIPWSSMPFMGDQKWDEGYSPYMPIAVPKEMVQGHKNFLNQEFNDRRYFAVKGKDSKGKKNIQYYDRKEKKLIDKLPLMPRINYGVKQLLTDQVMPVMNNNLVKGDNLLGLLSDKHREYDSSYDTSFGGYYDKDYVGTTTKMSKRGYPYKKKLYRQSAQDTSPTTKLLQRTGLSIQTKQPLSYYDKQERKEKTKKWREKHKKNK